MEQDYLVEKLSLQAHSFQEGFKILTKSDTIEEIIKNFRHLLRANFIITNIHLLHKKSFNSNWNSIVPKDNLDESDLSLLEHQEQHSVTNYDNNKYNAVIVFPLTDLSYSGILMGDKLDGSKFTDYDKITLQILIQVFSSAYDSFLNQKKEKKLIFELNEKILQLNNLIDAGIEISRYDNYEFLFEIALEKVASLANASSALICVNDTDNGINEKQIVFPNGITADKILNSEFKIESSFNFNKKIYRFILSGKETRKGDTHFNELDKLLLQAIARQVQTAIENDYLLKQSIEKDRIEKELLLAATIQKGILPKELPEIEGYELAGINIPSREVGGDYYDCINLGNGIYAFIIADVTGKGISAALLVNTLNAALYSYMEFKLPLSELTEKLNKLIFNATPADKFITFFIAVLDSISGTLDVVNAGHNPVLIKRKNGNLEKIEAGGLGLGMLDLGLPYQEQHLALNEGDNLFLYTDGIPEAMNKKEEEYSDERMFDFFNNNSDKPSSEFIKAIVNDVKNHADIEPQSDDITCLILKKL
jgi:sigma-B regulation protein RsbU (phosphoserine phosphatase)